MSGVRLLVVSRVRNGSMNQKICPLPEVFMLVLSVVEVVIVAVPVVPVVSVVPVVLPISETLIGMRTIIRTLAAAAVVAVTITVAETTETDRSSLSVYFVKRRTCRVDAGISRISTPGTTSSTERSAAMYV